MQHPDVTAGACCALSLMAKLALWLVHANEVIQAVAGLVAIGSGLMAMVYYAHKIWSHWVREH
jgi:hypothetical protein